MYTIDDLKVRLLSELKDIAEGLGVKNAKKLAKQDLIYKILDQQAVSGETTPAPAKAAASAPAPAESNDDRKMRPRKRENVRMEKNEEGSAPTSSQDLLDTISLDFNSMGSSNVGRY